MKQKLIFTAAVTGWALALTIHLLTFAGIAVNAGYYGFLFVGIFPLWYYAILKVRDNRNLDRYDEYSFWQRLNPILYFKRLFRNAPTWFRIVAVTCFYGAVISGWISQSHKHGDPGIQNGQYVLLYQGHLMKIITETEYNYAKIIDVRMWTGVIIGFYAFASAMVYPPIQSDLAKSNS